MSLTASITCLAWIAASALVATLRAARGAREGRKSRAIARLKSPTVYLFSGYLIIAALITPVSQGETASPLLGLAIAIPVCYALATLAAIGSERPPLALALALALLYGGSVLAAGMLTLALFSPFFVPALLR